MNAVRIRSRQKGFLVITAVFLIVVLFGLVVYLSTVSTTSQAASAADLNSTRAYQAARSGTEWAAYLLLRGVGTLQADCTPGPTTKTLTLGSTLSAFTVTVTCSSSAYTEGGVPVTRYSITSNACNEPTGGGACPNAATTSPTYVDREVTLAISN